MKINLFVLFTLATFASAASIDGLTQRQTNIVDKPTCGTTADAVLSDCKGIVDNWPDFPDWGPTCHYGVNTAWRPACSPGNCCIFTDWDGGLWADIKVAVEHLLGCGNEEKNSVNGVINVVNSGRVCIGAGTGCGDCFED